MPTPVIPVILCVDDEETALKLRAEVLKLSGYNVLSTTDPDHALRLFASYQVDLVILDHLLPGMTGTELGRQMRALRPATPMILLSGLVEPPEEMGIMDAFISKSEPTDDMLTKIAALIARKKTSGATSIS